MFVLIFVNLFIGFYFGQKILEEKQRQNNWSENLVKKVFWGYFIYLFLIFGIFFKSKAAYFVVIYLPIFALNIYCFIERKIYERQFSKDFCRFIDLVILRMRVGCSFRDSVRYNLKFQKFYFVNIISKIMDKNLYMRDVFDKKNSFLSRISQSFYKIDQHSHLSLSYLENLRYQLKLESDFRHKSGQITRQIHLQAYILTGMFIALNIFVLKNYGWQEHKSLLGGAWGLFVGGLLLMFRLGRKRKWKV